MLLGKRPRPHIRRTTSMTGFPSNAETQDSNHHPCNLDHQHDKQTVINSNNCISTDQGYDDHGRFLASMVLSPRNIQQHQRSSSSGGYVIQPPNFLTTCGLCSRPLPCGTDIYMYRGDTAFCSQECREKRMKQDERKQKYNMVTKKEEHPSRNHKTSTKGKTVATA